jgi:hypothetical protein
VLSRTAHAAFQAGDYAHAEQLIRQAAATDPSRAQWWDSIRAKITSAQPHTSASAPTGPGHAPPARAPTAPEPTRLSVVPAIDEPLEPILEATEDTPFEHAAQLEADRLELAELTAQLINESDSDAARAAADQARERLAAAGREPGWSLLLNPTPTLVEQSGATSADELREWVGQQQAQAGADYARKHLAQPSTTGSAAAGAATGDEADADADDEIAEVLSPGRSASALLDAAAPAGPGSAEQAEPVMALGAVEVATLLSGDQFAWGSAVHVVDELDPFLDDEQPTVVLVPTVVGDIAEYAEIPAGTWVVVHNLAPDDPRLSAGTATTDPLRVELATAVAEQAEAQHRHREHAERVAAAIADLRGEITRLERDQITLERVAAHHAAGPGQAMGLIVGEVAFADPTEAAAAIHDKLRETVAAPHDPRRETIPAIVQIRGISFDAQISRDRSVKIAIEGLFGIAPVDCGHLRQWSQARFPVGRLAELERCLTNLPAAVDEQRKRIASARRQLDQLIARPNQPTRVDALLDRKLGTAQARVATAIAALADGGGPAHGSSAATRHPGMAAAAAVTAPPAHTAAAPRRGDSDRGERPARVDPPTPAVAGDRGQRR